MRADAPPIKRLLPLLFAVALFAGCSGGVEPSRAPSEQTCPEDTWNDLDLELTTYNTNATANLGQPSMRLDHRTIGYRGTEEGCVPTDTTAGDLSIVVNDSTFTRESTGEAFVVSSALDLEPGLVLMLELEDGTTLVDSIPSFQRMEPAAENVVAAPGDTVVFRWALGRSPSLFTVRVAERKDLDTGLLTEVVTGDGGRYELIVGDTWSGTHRVTFIHRFETARGGGVEETDYDALYLHEQHFRLDVTVP